MFGGFHGTKTPSTSGFTDIPSTTQFGVFGVPSFTEATNKPADIHSPLQNPSVEKDCCGICLAAYKSPRILPCKHIFCRLCLTKLADKKTDGDRRACAVVDVIQQPIIDPFSCPLCRKEIKLSIHGIDNLPMYFEDDEDTNDDNEANDEANDDDEDQRVLCVVCENSVPAEYECFQCQKVFCVSCKIIHNNLLKHKVQDLKLDLSQGKCLKHPEVKVGYFCLDCCSTLCTVGVKSEHSLHQTQT
ncbi:hypothetical protein LOTGIDRAFT_147474, partial [Lottia gigantea]